MEQNLNRKGGYKMKYLLSYMTMFIAMIITLLLGGGFTTVLGISMLTLIFSTFFWETWLDITKRLKDAPAPNSQNLIKIYNLI